MIKDAEAQPDEELHRVRVLSTEASVPVELGCITLPGHGCLHQPGGSLNPMLLGPYGGLVTKALSIINSIFSPSPLSREWEVGLKIPTF